MSNRENENPSERSESSKSNGGGQPMALTEREYRVVFVPVGCQDYVKDDVIALFVGSPPPRNVTLNPGDICDGVRAELLS